MTSYQVVLVDDHDLPGDWAIARRRDGSMVAFMRRSKMTSCSMLEEAWAAAEECQHPPQRRLAHAV